MSMCRPVEELLKKSARGVLAPFSCSRTPCTLLGHTALLDEVF